MRLRSLNGLWLLRHPPIDIDITISKCPRVRLSHLLLLLLLLVSIVLLMRVVCSEIEILHTAAEVLQIVVRGVHSLLL